MRWRHFDWALLLTTLALLAFGLVNVASTAFDMRSELYRGYLFRQMIWVVLGLGVFCVCQLVSYTRIERFVWLGYALCLLLVVATLFMPPIKGARRWIRVGPIPFQPSEPMKLMLILALARVLKHCEPGKGLRALLPALALTAVPLLVIAKQPDLSTSMTLLPVLGAMLFVAGARREHLVRLVLLGLCVAPLGLMMLKPYQRERLQTYFAGGQLTRQQQLDQAYQAIQAEIAVGSGGVLGKGWRQGTQVQSGFVPEPHNDFIFCVIAEEWGLAGSAALLALYGLLIGCCLGAAQTTREPFGQLVATGVAALIATQVICHVAINVRLFPVTGLTLPLVSCGGTSLVTTMAGLALVSNIRLWHTPTL